MQILWHHAEADFDYCAKLLSEVLPEANVRQWKEGDNEPADYAIVRLPPDSVIHSRPHLKAVFSLSAGVDDLISRYQQDPALFASGVQLYRIEDGGMAQQMREYALWCVLGWYRRFADYRVQQQQQHWQPLAKTPREDFNIGIMGAGILGAAVAETLRDWGFTVCTWSRSARQLHGITTFNGPDQLAAFLSDSQVLINLLPLTTETYGILNEQLFNHLPKGAFLLNLARGEHLVPEALITAVENGHIAQAYLDTTTPEPLPTGHPLWTTPNIYITPHIAAETDIEGAISDIAKAIRQLERGESVKGRVDLHRGY